MSILPLALIVLFCLVPLGAQTDCPLLEASDLGDDGLIAASIMDIEPENIQLLDHNIVCLAQGSGKDLYRMVSVIARYMSSDSESMITTAQFHFECDNGAWSINVLGAAENSMSNTTLVGNLTTPLRSNCSLCTDTISSSPAEHCVACDSDCVGLMACDETGSDCCNFFGLNGTCISKCPQNSTSNSDFQCYCDMGFMPDGSDCINTDDCLPNPCQNQGNCSDLVNDYSCTCLIGYTDKNCSTNINECFPDPCLNGICIDLLNDYRCTCLPGFSDKNCSVNINECFPDPCQNGNCTDLVNDYTCACEPGYSNKNCAVNIDDCSPNPCQNGGVCLDRLSSFSCDCLELWTGSVCETCLIPHCTQCIAEPSQNKTICSRCNEGFYLNSSSSCGELVLSRGSNPGRQFSDCPSEGERDSILVNVLQLLSSEFGVHPLGLSRAFAAPSCEQALSVHPEGTGRLYWINNGNTIQQQYCV